jgi:hypothetical protein
MIRQGLADRRALGQVLRMSSAGLPVGVLQNQQSQFEMIVCPFHQGLADFQALELFLMMVSAGLPVGVLRNQQNQFEIIKRYECEAAPAYSVNLLRSCRI